MHPFTQRAVGQRALQRDHHRRAHHRAENGADAAQQGHQDHLSGHVPVGIGQRRKLEHHCLGRASQAGQSRGDDEGQQLVRVDVVAQRDRPRLVFANRLEHLTVGRMDGALDDHEAKHEHRQHEVVQGHVVLHVEQTEQMPARYALHAVFATGKRRLDEDKEHHLRQRQGDHREVDALPANRQQAEDEAQHGGRQCPGDYPQFGTQTRIGA